MPSQDGLRSAAVHWLPAPASATVVDVVDGGCPNVVVLELAVVVVVEADVLGADDGVGVPAQPARSRTQGVAITKPTRSRFTSRKYLSAHHKSGRAFP